MASAKFLEEALSTDVDESAVSAIVGSLETQLTTTPSTAIPHSVLSQKKTVLNGPEFTSVTPECGTVKNNFVAHPSTVGSNTTGGGGNCISSGSTTAASVQALITPNGLQNSRQKNSTNSVTANSPVVFSKLQTQLQLPTSVCTPTNNFSINAHGVVNTITKSKPTTQQPATVLPPGTTTVNATGVTSVAPSMLHRKLTATRPHHTPTQSTDSTSDRHSAVVTVAPTLSNFGSSTISVNTSIASRTSSTGKALQNIGGNSVTNMPSTAAAANSPSLLNNNNNSPSSGVISPALLQAGGLPASGYLASSTGTVVTTTGVLANNNIASLKPSVVVQPNSVSSTLANGTIPSNSPAASYVQFTSAGSVANGSTNPSIITSQHQQARVITQAPIVNPVSLFSSVSSAGTHHIQHTQPTTHIVSSTNSASNVVSNNIHSGSGFSSLANSNHGLPLNSSISNVITTSATKLSAVNSSTLGVGATSNIVSPQVTAMTVNVNSGAASGSSVGTGVGVSQSQTVVLTKPHQAGITMTMAPTHNTTVVTTGSTVPGQQQPTIINTAGGIQILNMNAMRPGNAQGIGQSVQKLAPRMIINPQVLAGARPGQPGVHEKQSEFSEFLKQNSKHESEGVDDDCDGDQTRISPSDIKIESEGPDTNPDQDEIDERALLESSDNEEKPYPVPLYKPECADVLSDSYANDSPSPTTVPEHTYESHVSPIKQVSPEKSPFPSDFDPDIIFLKSMNPIGSEKCVQNESNTGKTEDEELICKRNSSGGDSIKNSKVSTENPEEILVIDNDDNETTKKVLSPKKMYNQQVESESFNSSGNGNIIPEHEPKESCDSVLPYHHSINNTNYNSAAAAATSDYTKIAAGARNIPSHSNYQSSHPSQSRPSAIQPQNNSQSVASSAPVICYSQTSTSSSPLVSPTQSHVESCPTSSHNSQPTSHEFSNPGPGSHIQIHVRVPPIQIQPKSQPSHQPVAHQSPTTVKEDLPRTSIPKEYKSTNQKCFTTDAQLHSQFLQYTQHHPIGTPPQQPAVPQRNVHPTSSHPTSAPVLHTHPDAKQYSQSQQYFQYPDETTAPVQHPVVQKPPPPPHEQQHSYRVPQQQQPYPYINPNHQFASPPPPRMTTAPVQPTNPNYSNRNLPSVAPISPDCAYSPNYNTPPRGSPGHSESPGQGMVHPNSTASSARSHAPNHTYDLQNPYSHPHAHQIPPPPSRPSISSQLPSPTSYHNNPQTAWMSIAQSNTSKLSNTSPHTLRSPDTAPPSQQMQPHNPRYFPPQQQQQQQYSSHPQLSPTQLSPHRNPYPSQYASYPITNQNRPDNQQRYPGPARYSSSHGQQNTSMYGPPYPTANTNPSVIRPAIPNVPGGVSSHSHSTSINEANYSQQQYKNDYSRGPSGPSQYYPGQQSNNGSSSGVVGMYSSNNPVVCRVVPQRVQYEQGYSGSGRGPPVPNQGGAYNNSIGGGGGSGSNGNRGESGESYFPSPLAALPRSYNNSCAQNVPSPTIPSSSQERTVQRGRPGPHEGDGGYEQYESYFGSSCQYDESMGRMRTQITLQALPGLPPGAQGHHLLVKTENGQYQLLRVGMPAPTPTAATGTPVVPTTAATSTSMSIAPQLSNPSASLISTQSNSTTTNHLNNSSLVSSMAALTSSIPQVSSSHLVTPSILTTSATSHSFINTISSPSSGSPSPLTHINLHHHHHQQQQQQQQQQSIVNPVAATTTVVGSSHGVNPSIILPPNVSMNSTTRPIASSTTISSHTSTTTPNNNPTMSASPNTTTYRLQNVPTVPPTTTNNVQSGVGMTASVSMQQQQAHPQVPQASAPSSAPTNANAATANSVSQMSAETAKIKCKNFLSFLLELSAKQNQQVARNVKSLIQGLVDGKVNAEDFSDRLQKEVNSQPQPCLVGFLKKSLPHLRHSLATNELKIEGIKPPTLSSVVPAAPVTALIPQNQIRPPAAPVPTTPVRIITPINSTIPPPVTTAGNTTAHSAPIPRSTAAAVQQRFASVRPTKSNTSAKAKANNNASLSSSLSTSTPVSKSSGPLASKSSSKEKDKKASFASSGYSGDDDINDVAAMGGVNLAEESQRILGSTEFVGTQIRSCKDEIFLQSIPLQSKIKAIAAKHGLEEPPSEVAAMISHATEERLKYLLEKLSVIAEHRLDVIKMDDRYEVTQDVKGQLRFLEELDKLERKRHDEQEREMMMRAAKSRSKSEDPEQAKLKAKAKEMQRVAMEEMRQREANLTALQAIGPRKKPKLDAPSGSQSTTAQNSMGGLGASNSLNRPQMGLRPRLKRVNLRDLLFLMEQEKETMRSTFLYKHLLLK